MLAAIVRLADKVFLTPNLERSNIIVNSKTVGDRLKRYNRIFNFTIINPGCVVRQIIRLNNQESMLCRWLNNSDKPRLLLSFSRLNTIQKGIGTILEAASRLPSYQFMIAGPHDATLKTIDMTRIPVNVQIIVKEFSEHEKGELFRKCDVFLSPYLNEDFGITPIEANAYGKAVVYCDDSGEIVRTQKHKDTGFKCGRTPESIVEGIQFCLRNKDNMKSYCIKNASNYTWHNFEEAFRSYIYNLNLT